jgi:hypothetical protein
LQVRRGHRISLDCRIRHVVLTQLHITHSGDFQAVSRVVGICRFVAPYSGRPTAT